MDRYGGGEGGRERLSLTGLAVEKGIKIGSSPSRR